MIFSIALSNFAEYLAIMMFTISQLSRFSGIKAHTIRAWESRYRVLRPHRTGGNTRYYDSTQMNRFMLLSDLVKAGYKASDVGRMPDSKLRSLLEDFYTNSHPSEDYFICQLIAAGMSYDTTRFEKVYGICLDRFRLKYTYQMIILPMLERVGLMWRCDKASPAQEHFISNLLRKNLFAALGSMPPPNDTAEKWLLFLPEDEYHELGLLMAYILIRIAGQEVIYLGASVPWAALPGAIRETQPDKLLFFNLFQEMPKSSLMCLQKLSETFNGSRIYAAGLTAGIVGAVPSPRIGLLSCVEDLVLILTPSA